MKKSKVLLGIFTFFMILNNNFVLATTDGKLNIQERGIDKIFFLAVGVLLLGLVLFFGYKIDENDSEAKPVKTKKVNGTNKKQEPEDEVYQVEENENYITANTEEDDDYEEDEEEFEEESLFSVRTVATRRAPEPEVVNKFDSTMVFDSNDLKDEEEYNSDDDEDFNIDIEDEEYSSDDDEDFNLEIEEDEIEEDDEDFNIESEEEYNSDDDEDFNLEIEDEVEEDDEEDDFNSGLNDETVSFNMNPEMENNVEKEDNFLKELEEYEEDEDEEFVGFTTISSPKKKSYKEEIEKPVIEEIEPVEEISQSSSVESEIDLQKAFLEEMNKNLINNKKSSKKEGTVKKTTTKASSLKTTKTAEEKVKKTKTTTKKDDSKK